jgi:orotidine-5'-phosphate decarboxylase
MTIRPRRSRRISTDRRLIVALDVPSLDGARRLVAALDGLVGFYKLGMWLLFEPGADAFVAELVGAGLDVFLDYKLHDIGETVRAGAASIARRGARFLTVHAEPQVMRAAVDGAAGSSLGILGVTVLTSLDDAALQAAGYSYGVTELVARRVRAAAEAGCAGVIASAADEPRRMKEIAGRDLLVVTPGIRLPGDDTGDQKRVMTPRQAIIAGADYLVIGRPIVRALQAREAAARVLEDMNR